uniref:Uncharacterized protein n=1 Tax=Poecilia formosa TaxID=48698 RepID=A0A096MD11_POEFO
ICNHTNNIRHIVLSDSKPVGLQGCQCTCVTAMLFQTAHYSQLSLPAVPPVLSCTDTEQKWNKPRTMGIKPGPVKDMVILSAMPRNKKIFEGIRSNLFKVISTLRINEVYQGLSPQEAPLITTMAVSSDVRLVDSMFGTVQEGSVLSYQLAARTVPRTHPHHEAPPPPQL